MSQLSKLFAVSNRMHIAPSIRSVKRISLHELSANYPAALKIRKIFQLPFRASKKEVHRDKKSRWLRSSFTIKNKWNSRGKALRSADWFAPSLSLSRSARGWFTTDRSSVIFESRSRGGRGFFNEPHVTVPSLISVCRTWKSGREVFQQNGVIFLSLGLYFQRAMDCCGSWYRVYKGCIRGNIFLILTRKVYPKSLHKYNEFNIF